MNNGVYEYLMTTVTI